MVGRNNLDATRAAQAGGFSAVGGDATRDHPVHPVDSDG